MDKGKETKDINVAEIEISPITNEPKEKKIVEDINSNIGFFTLFFAAATTILSFSGKTLVYSYNRAIFEYWNLDLSYLIPAQEIMSFNFAFYVILAVLFIINCSCLLYIIKSKNPIKVLSSIEKKIDARKKVFIVIKSVMGRKERLHTPYFYKELMKELAFKVLFFLIKILYFFVKLLKVLLFNLVLTISILFVLYSGNTDLEAALSLTPSQIFLGAYMMSLLFNGICVTCCSVSVKEEKNGKPFSIFKMVNIRVIGVLLTGIILYVILFYVIGFMAAPSKREFKTVDTKYIEHSLEEEISGYVVLHETLEEYVLSPYVEKDNTAEINTAHQILIKKINVPSIKKSFESCTKQ